MFAERESGGYTQHHFSHSSFSRRVQLIVFGNAGISTALSDGAFPGLTDLGTPEHLRSAIHPNRMNIYNNYCPAEVESNLRWIPDQINLCTTEEVFLSMTFQLANYLLPDSKEVQAGLVRDGKIVETVQLLRGRPSSLQDVYQNWDVLEPQLKDLVVEKDGKSIDHVTLLPPSLEASSVYFAGFNYRDHVANMAKVFNLPNDPDAKSAGLTPWYNLKPRNTLCGSGHSVELPTPKVDWEIELAVVIGREARRVAVKDALDYVAGYTIAIDLSARDRAFREHTSVESVSRMDWIAQKGFEDACPIGPWLTPAHQLSDPQNLEMKLTVNGEVMQDSNTSNMIFSVAESIEHLSNVVTLSPGDIILTGTPAGTGAESGRFLKKGDLIKATISGLGELVVHCH